MISIHIQTILLLIFPILAACFGNYVPIPVVSRVPDIILSAIQPEAAINHGARTQSIASLIALALDTVPSALETASNDFWKTVQLCIKKSGILGRETLLLPLPITLIDIYRKFEVGSRAREELDYVTPGSKQKVRFVSLDVSVSIAPDPEVQTNDLIVIYGTCPGDASLIIRLSLPCTLDWLDEKTYPKDILCTSLRRLTNGQTVDINRNIWNNMLDQYEKSQTDASINPVSEISFVPARTISIILQENINMFLNSFSVKVRFPDIIGGSGVMKKRVILSSKSKETGVLPGIQIKDNGLRRLKLLVNRFLPELATRNHEPFLIPMIGSALTQSFIILKTLMLPNTDAVINEIELNELATSLEEHRSYWVNNYFSTEESDINSIQIKIYLLRLKDKQYTHIGDMFTSWRTFGYEDEPDVQNSPVVPSNTLASICAIVGVWSPLSSREDVVHIPSDIKLQKFSDGWMLKCQFKEMFPVTQTDEEPETKTPLQSLKDLIKLRNPETMTALTESLSQGFLPLSMERQRNAMILLVNKENVDPETDPHAVFDVKTIEERYPTPA